MMTGMSEPRNPSRVDRPVALITGATRGIGRATAEALGASHHILVGGRSSGAVHAVVRSLPSAGPFVADLGDEASLIAATQELDELDVLVHCAGVIPPREGTLRERWRAVFEINMFAVAQMTELLLPALRARRGLIVFVNSGAGLRAMGDVGGYSASKFALTSYAEGLREVERGRVRVGSIHPGRVDTDMQRDLQARQGRDYRPEDHLTVAAVAAAVRAMVEAPADAVVETLVLRPAG